MDHGKDFLEEGPVMDNQDDKREKRQTKTQSTFMKLFDCPVCFERISPPVTTCVNGHAVCQQCRRQLLTCPTCKGNFSPYKNTMIDQIIEENMYLCKFSEKGCTVELKFREIELHEKKHCRHRTIKCEIRSEEVCCGEEVAIWAYYIHVLRNHKQETMNFRTETHRVLNISGDFRQTNILKDLASQKIIFETVKLDRGQHKFFITYQFIGLFDDSVFTLRIYSRTQKYKEIIFRNLCAPIGITDDDAAFSDKCLIIDPALISSFAQDDELCYSIKIESLPRKWYEVLRDKCGLKSVRLGSKGELSSAGDI